jgi:hypothetical protein
MFDKEIIYAIGRLFEAKLESPERVALGAEHPRRD